MQLSSFMLKNFLSFRRELAVSEKKNYISLFKEVQKKIKEKKKKKQFLIKKQNFLN